MRFCQYYSDQCPSTDLYLTACHCDKGQRERKKEQMLSKLNPLYEVRNWKLDNGGSIKTTTFVQVWGSEKITDLHPTRKSFLHVV